MKAPKQPAAPKSKGIAAKPCPICAAPRDEKYAPFCSRRCADVDLYRWLKGGYVIPGAPAAGGEPRDDDDS